MCCPAACNSCAQATSVSWLRHCHIFNVAVCKHLHSCLEKLRATFSLQIFCSVEFLHLNKHTKQAAAIATYTTPIMLNITIDAIASEVTAESGPFGVTRLLSLSTPLPARRTLLERVIADNDREVMSSAASTISLIRSPCAMLSATWNWKNRMHASFALAVI